MTRTDLIARLEKEGGSRELVDKNGRPICIGDILKRYYMYKQVVGVIQLGINPKDYLKISHLNMRPDEYYTERLDGRRLEDVEIVQSPDANFESRTRRALEDGK